MVRYVELRGKRTRRSTLIHLIYEKVEDMVFLSGRGYRWVVFRGSTIATLKIIKDDDDDDDDNLEAALDMVATHPKKEY